ncbi:MAG: 4-(cytidine 5'-diphospho)-2-C-methyl-D-erythritol kinase [Paramuribaculum sp.]|nr:4-(cytidine 5'-diphospho)-2-C-methyl-D-erythritol kinase [Paramuribaculum sp.]
MVVFPNSKINLGLNIISRRTDGYHNISSVMVPIGWCDVLELVPSKSTATTLTVSGRKVDCLPEKNLVMKAFRAVNERTELPPTDIYLRKIIPDGAGLGGGSADAAFTVKALNSLYSLGMNDDEMAEICSTIGADCPFFIYNRPMLASDTGTTLSPICIPLPQSIKITVIKPDVSISTAEAYSGVSPHIPQYSITDILSTPIKNWRGKLVNDFESQMAGSHPRIASLLNMLYEHGAIYAAMSGSGSAVFGLFDDVNMSDLVTHLDDTDAYYAGTLNF